MAAPGILLAVSLALGGAPAVLHLEAPSSSWMGEAIPIAVAAEGPAEAGLRLDLCYRALGAGDFTCLAMRRGPDDRYHASILPAATRGPAVSYYVEASDPRSGWRHRLGSPERPSSVALEPPANGGSATVLRTAVAMLSLSLLGGLVWYRDQRRRDPATADGRRLAPDGGPAEPTIDGLRAELADQAMAIGRLSASAWLLSSIGSVTGRSGQSLLQPLAETRELVQRAQALLREPSLGPAREQLAGLRARVSEIAQMVSRTEQAVSADEMAAHMARRTVPADILGRLLDHYMMDSRRSPEGARKLALLARAVAVRAGADGSDPAAVRRLLTADGLLRGCDASPLPEAMRQGAARLRQAIQTSPARGHEQLAPLVAQLAAWRDGLGRRIYTLDGLSELVALELGLEGKREVVERHELGTVDGLVNELHGIDPVSSAGGRAAGRARPGSEEGDQAAARLLGQTEQALRESVRAGNPGERGFFLDPEELQAVTAEDDDSEFAALVIEATICRTAIDQLAQRHALARQPEGAAPAPLPRPLASGLIGRAAEVESDLQAHVTRALRRGDNPAARASTRLLHRLARARLGLAVLGNLPATGRDETEGLHA